MESMRNSELNEFYNLSPVKRDKLLKEKREEHKKKLRAGLKVLTKDEIRYHRLPFHEALLQELTEYGFIHSVEYIKQLFEFQEQMFTEMNSESDAWRRPKLIDSKAVLFHLKEALCAAETAYIANSTDVYCEHLLQIAIDFAFGSEDWWWLGEQILVLVVALSDKFEDEMRKLKALASYAFGKYLLDQVKNIEGAQYFLSNARELSKGAKWTVKRYFPEIKSTIFCDTCFLLYKLLYHLAKTAKDPHEIIDFCINAKNRAAEACYYQGIFEALILKGDTLMHLNQSFEAITVFSSALNVAEKVSDAEKTCQAKINLALAYLAYGQPKTALWHLEAVREYNVDYYIGQALRFLGRYYLQAGMAAKATPLLEQAFKLFKEDFPREREGCRILAGVCKGSETYDLYTRLIVDSGDSNVALLKLVSWKESRLPFWRVSEIAIDATKSALALDKYLEDPSYNMMKDILEEIITKVIIISDLSCGDEFCNYLICDCNRSQSIVVEEYIAEEEHLSEEFIGIEEDLTGELEEDSIKQEDIVEKNKEYFDEMEQDEEEEKSL